MELLVPRGFGARRRGSARGWSSNRRRDTAPHDGSGERGNCGDHDIPDADVYQGPDGFLAWVAQWGESWETWSLEDLQVRAAGPDRAVALFRMVAKGVGSGVEVDRLDGVAYTLADRSIVRMDYFNNQQQALEAVGLTD